MSWRWVFYINVPIGVAAVIFGALFLGDPRQDNPGRFDVAGFVLAGAGLSLLMFGVSEGPARGWSDPLVIAACVAGVAGLAAMAVVELRKREPMLDLRLYANRLFRSTLTAVTLMSISFFGVVYLRCPLLPVRPGLLGAATPVCWSSRRPSGCLRAASSLPGCCTAESVPGESWSPELS